MADAEIDDRELDGLEPADLLEREAARIDAWLKGFDDDDPQWQLPSRCEGWSVRDVLAHLAADEVYFHACLDGTVGRLMAEMGEKGATDLASFNELGIRSFDDTPPTDLLAHWRAENEITCRGFRERADGSVDTSVGEYPARWQGCHLAHELAVHADDIGVPVTDAERSPRRGWLARVSRFALAEAKPELSITVEGDRTSVTDGEITVTLGEQDLIDAVAGRLGATSAVGGREQSMLRVSP